MTVRDINSLRRKLRLKDGRYHLVHVKDVLRGQGILRMPKRKDLVLDSVRHLVNMFPEILLGNATQQINCGGYNLWHDKVVDGSGLGRSIFYALLAMQAESTSFPSHTIAR